MPILQKVSTPIFLCILAFTIPTQPPTWKSVSCGKASLSYPPTWHLTKETNPRGIHVTLTPDSMQQLTMRMVELYDLHQDSLHTYAFFKKEAMLHWQKMDGTKMVKTEEITFKGRQCMYVELMQSSRRSKCIGSMAALKFTGSC